MNKLAELREYAKKHGKLFFAHIEITDVCNFRCNHCYISKAKNFISFDEAKFIVDILLKKEVFHVTLTGGEPLIHPDFVKIYKLMKNAGMHVTLFSNGSLFSDEIISLLKALPPIQIEISLYGHDEASYCDFVKRKNKFGVVLNNLRKLKEAGLNVIIKFTLMKDKEQKMEYVKKLGEQLNIDVRCGLMVLATLDGNAQTKHLRISSDQAACIELDTDDRKQAWKEEVEKHNFSIRKEMKCRAGITSLAISADKKLSICALLRTPSYKFTDTNTLSTGIKEVYKKRKEIEQLYKTSACSSCTLSKLCFSCPGISFLENRNYTSCVSYTKEVVLKKLDLVATRPKSKSL